MNIRRLKYRFTLIARIWAMLLLVIFINTTVTESFHYHESECLSLPGHKLGKSDLHGQLLISGFKCKLCDLLKHYAHFYTLPAAHPSGFSLAKLLEKSFIFITGKFSILVLPSSNKGPPGL